VLGIELLHAPLEVFVVELAGSSDGAIRRVRVAVDGLDGTVRRLDADVAAAAGVGSAKLLPATVSRESAHYALANEFPFHVLQVSLRSRTAWRIARVDALGTLAYPYWVLHELYGERRGFRALDAWSGAHVGARGRASLLRGMVAARRESLGGSA